MAKQTAKRKAQAISQPNASSKKIKAEAKTAKELPSSNGVISTDPLRQPHPLHKEAEEHGIVLRNYYPHEMSNARARAYGTGELLRPIDVLNTALADTAAARKKIRPRNAVVHWFKMDLRTRDNRALSMASHKAHDAGVPLIGLYILSPQDFEAHLTAPVRVDFMLRSLAVLQEEMAKLNIPLWMETVEKRAQIPARILQLIDEWGADHLFANMEYEVDELRREARLVRLASEQRKAVEVVHDTCVVAPGQLATGAGKQYAVYSPWFRAWLRHVRENPELLELAEPPHKNPDGVREELSALFACKVPEPPAGKKLQTADDAERYRALWPAGELEAAKRLQKFCEGPMIEGYARNRNFPDTSGTSSLSVHFSSGTLSTRTAVRAARDRNKTRKLDGGSEGVQSWISEVAWRDFYKHILVHWPYICMNKPFKPEYANITWSYDMARFEAWAAGCTGFPLVDAAMRQLQRTGWMHNRCRMVVASFLAKDLRLDWRLGERHFMERLVDGDFASNNGGWGFAASVGADPQPYFRVFNPVLQSEKFDSEGNYIRKWVPELKGVSGRAVHDPYGRGAGDAARRAGYPEMIVEHARARGAALAMYKEGIARDS